MQTRHKISTLILLALILVLILAGCSAANTPTTNSTTPVVATPTRAHSEGNVTAEGAIVPVAQSTLSFMRSGRVVEVLAAAGDVVAAGQPLARLDARDFEAVVRQAEANLASAQAQLDKLQAGPRPVDLAPAQAAVQIAQANVLAAEKAAAALDGNVASARAALAGAQARLDKLLAGATAREISIAQKEVERAQNVLYGLQRQRDATFNVNEGQIGAAQNSVEIAQLQLENLKAGPRVEDVALARANVSEAQAAVQIAQGQQAQGQAQVDTARAQLDQAQAQLALLQAGARDEDIASAEAAVAQAEAALDAARDALDDAVLKAPYAGSVALALINTGELVSPELPAFQFGDLSRLQVQTEDLSEVDIAQVQLGQQAEVTVDALNGGKTFKGQVVRIEPLATDLRGDKVYRVTIDLGVGAESGLRWGMSTLVEIDTQ